MCLHKPAILTQLRVVGPLCLPASLLPLTLLCCHDTELYDARSLILEGKGPCKGLALYKDLVRRDCDASKMTGVRANACGLVRL